MVRRLLGGTHVVEVIMPLLSGPSLSHASDMLHFFQDIFRESQPKPRGWGLDLHFVCTARPEMVAAVAMSAQLRLSPDLDAAAGTELRHECAIPPNRVQGEQVNLHVIIQLHSSPPAPLSFSAHLMAAPLRLHAGTHGMGSLACKSLHGPFLSQL